MTGNLDQRQLASVRRAAAALVAQEGAGVPREVLVGLAGHGMELTLHADAEPVIAVVHRAEPRSGAFATLTAREHEVAALLAAGRTNAEIASELVIALGTVKDHVHNILEKTGLRSRAAVAAAWHGYTPTA
jgi:DNA-binding NarL/FixJ family response regulator